MTETAENAASLPRRTRARRLRPFGARGEAVRIGWRFRRARSRRARRGHLLDGGRLHRRRPRCERRARDGRGRARRAPPQRRRRARRRRPRRRSAHPAAASATATRRPLRLCHRLGRRLRLSARASLNERPRARFVHRMATSPPRPRLPRAPRAVGRRRREVRRRVLGCGVERRRPGARLAPRRRRRGARHRPRRVARRVA